MKTPAWRSAAIAVLCLSILNMGLMSAAQAAIVDTGALVATDRDESLAAIHAQLDRADVRAQMEKMGVDAASIDRRVAALSDSELGRLAQEMEKAPAGGSLLAVIGVVFVVLLILEVTGVIDIFKRNPR